MGEVYKAKDTKLGRDVAVKVLPETVAQNPEVLGRFEREARAVAALNHPNILGIYDFGNDAGVAYAVMELLEGEDLRVRLDKGAVPQRKAVEIAIQIAKGLSAAHEKGVIHRDLKPENLFLTLDGRVKILDFGLAKVFSSERATTNAPTTPAGTEPGTVMGTVGYMSPEQVRGRDVDQRTDIFSFGAILFEMLSGVRAFKKDSPIETMNAILKDEPPDLLETGKKISPALDRIVRHCLEKNPEARFHSSGDVAFALESLGDTSSSAAGIKAGTLRDPFRSRRSSRALLPSLLGAAVLAAIAFVAGRGLRREPDVSWTGTLLGGPEVSLEPRISPDGHTLALQAMVRENTQVAVMKPESGNWQVLTHRSGVGYIGDIAWSMDGNRIYFDRTADVPIGVYSVPVLGGDEQLVLEDAEAPTPLPDGSLLLIKLNAQRALQLFRFWPDSGRLQEFPLVFGSQFWSQVRLFPDDKEFVVIARRMGKGTEPVHVYAVDLGSGAIRRIEMGLPEDSISALATTPDNTSILVAALSQDLTRVIAVPRKGGRPSRPLFTLTQPVQYLDCAGDGSIYAGGQLSRAIVARFPASGGRASRIAAPLNFDSGFLVPLADGRIVVAQILGGRSRLAAVESNKDPVPVVTTNEETAPPVTRVGEGELAFLIGPEPRRTIAVASLAKGRITRRIPFDRGRIASLAASPDGKTIYSAAGGSIWAIPASGEPRRICAGDSAAADPGGRSLIVQILEAPRARLLHVPLDGGASREIALNGPFRLTFDPLNSAEISADGRLLVPLASLDSWFFVPGMIDLSTGRMARITTDQFGDYHSLAWSTDGQVVAGTNEMRSAIWKFAPEKR
jgi:serine/threonine protein kinase/WD40 repeat protein